MNRVVLIKHMQDVRETLCKIGGIRHGRIGISAMDLKKVLNQTVRELRREVNKKVLKVPEIEIKVCEATSNEPWGPHGTIMGDIAQATRNFQEYHMIMGVLWKRLHDSGKNWRHVYKSLTVMEYLIANGAERVIDELREQAYQIQALLDFQYIEPNGKDQGINVQKKAQSLVALINDRGKIRELRRKANANRDKYRGLSSTGITFKPSSYLSTSGSYGDKDDERYCGGSSMKAQKDDDGRELESRSQREYNRDDCSCGEREHNEVCASSKGGDHNSDNLSSTEGDRSYDIDEYRQYSRCSGNRGVVAAVTRAQTSLSQSSSGPTSQLPPRKAGRELFFTIKSAADDFDDFDPRGTSKPSVVPVAKDESSTLSHNALEDLFTDVEFQTSFPSISAPASNNVLEQDYVQTPYAFNEASKPNSINSTSKDEFHPFRQAFPRTNDTGLIDGTSFDSCNPSFASFNESPKSTTQKVLNGGFHPVGDNSSFSINEQFKVGSRFLGSPSKTLTDNPDLFGSFNPFSTQDHVMAGNQAAQQQQSPHTNPFLSTTSASAFWDDPLITSLVDLTIGPGQKQDQNAPLSMNEFGISMAASGSAVFRANSLPLGATTLSYGRQMNSTIGPGRSVSDLPKPS